VDGNRLRTRASVAVKKRIFNGGNHRRECKIKWFAAKTLYNRVEYIMIKYGTCRPSPEGRMRIFNLE
jgi:hypothetical protein